MTDKRARETCSGRQKSRKTGETGTCILFMLQKFQNHDTGFESES